MLFSIFSIILNFCGALALLLFGMNMLSSGIQKGAGNSLQHLLKIVSGNRFTAVLTGLVVTSIIQSSSATTVMVVSFVNAEILSLAQAIGIIFGANIGTTITAWIVSLFGFSFSISSFAVPLFGIGFIIISIKKWKFHDAGEVFMGFGILFLGLGLLSKTLKLSPSSVAFLQHFSDLGALGIFIGVLAGAVITALIHSSSAMTAIILTMAYNGSLSWELAAALVLGSNIGTTIDAGLSSIGASTNARRAAAVHIGFNIAGTLLAVIVLRPFLQLVDLIVPGAPQENITTHIAMLHTVFNICCTLVFLPFVHHIEELVTKFIKEPEGSADTVYKLPIIISGVHDSVELYIMQTEKEIGKMAARVLQMFDEVFTALRKHDKKTIAEAAGSLFEQEDYIDQMNEGITAFLIKCSQMDGAGNGTQNRVAQFLLVTDQLECLSDECAGMIHTLKKYIEKGKEVKTSDYEKLLPYMTLVREFFDYTNHHITGGFSASERENAARIENEIDRIQKQLRKIARKRLEDGNDVKSELQYIDLVRRIEKAGDYVYGIVKAL